MFAEKEQQDLENERSKQHRKKLKRRLRAVASFFIFFSVFLLLNTMIGYSSAPFYEPRADCNVYEESVDCQRLFSIT